MLAFIELFLILALAVFLFTQVMLPALRRQKIFPLFRKQGKLEKELDDAKQSVVDHSIEVQINETLKTIYSDEAVTGDEEAPVPAVKPKAKRKTKVKNV